MAHQGGSGEAVLERAEQAGGRGAKTVGGCDCVGECDIFTISARWS